MTESVPSASRLPVTAAVELLQQRLQDAESRVRWASEELAQAQRRLAQAEGEAAEFRQALALLQASLLGAKGPEGRSRSLQLNRSTSKHGEAILVSRCWRGCSIGVGAQGFGYAQELATLDLIGQAGHPQVEFTKMEGPFTLV